jgi:hypothetical protein
MFFFSHLVVWVYRIFCFYDINGMMLLGNLMVYCKPTGFFLGSFNLVSPNPVEQVGLGLYFINFIIHSLTGTNH